MMKNQLNEYYQCSDRGYVKYQNVKVEHLPIINEIPVSSRCNQILSYKMHGIEVKKPIEIGSPKQIPKLIIQQANELPKLQGIPKHEGIPKYEGKTSTLLGPLNYSFSVSLLQNPINNFQKDEVRSIHIDDKTSPRTKADQREKDLSNSTFTYQRKPKYDMKRSLFQTNRSHLTTDTSCKDTERLDMIVNELAKEKEKREEFQKKYQLLFNMVNNNQNTKRHQTAINNTQYSEHTSPKYSTLTSRKKNYHIKSETESSQQSENQKQPIVDYRKGRRKSSSPTPIIINLGPQLLYRNSPSSPSKFMPSSQEQVSELTELKGSLQLIQHQVAMLNESVEFLQKKSEEQDARRQKDLLMFELNEKQRKIDEIIKENQKIKEINEQLRAQKQSFKKNQNAFQGLNLQKHTITFSFTIMLLIVLLMLIFRSPVCYSTPQAS